MGKQNVTRVIAFLMIATFASSIMTACGDGKDHKRAKNSRNLPDKPAGKPDDKDKGKTTPPADDGKDKGAQTTPPADDGKTTTTGDQTPEQKEALAKLNADLKRIADATDAFNTTGTAIDKNQLEDGKYKLAEVVSTVFYTVKQEVARAIQTSAIVELGDGRIQPQQTSIDKTASTINNVLAARKIEIALSFEVKKDNGTFAAARSSFSPALVNTSVTNKLDMTTNLEDSAADASPVMASMIDMLGKVTADASLVYKMQDENKREISMTLKKVSDTELNVVVAVDEETDQAKEDNNGYTFQRLIVMKYKFEKAVAADDNKVVLTQPDQADQPAAPAPVKGQDDDLGKAM
jgi:hypothetical protein